MGKPKGEKTFKQRNIKFGKTGSSDNPNRNLGKDAPGHYRDRATIKRLRLYKQRPTRDKQGNLLHGDLMSKDVSHKALVQPDRRWFGNTRVISQTELDKFREEMKSKMNDPFTVLLRQRKLPLSLINDHVKVRTIVTCFCVAHGICRRRRKST